MNLINIMLVFITIIFQVTALGKKTLLQFETEGAFISVAPHRSLDSAGTDGFGISTNIYLSQPFTKATSLVLDQRLRSYGSDPVFPWLSLPIENHIYAGLRFEGAFGMLQLGASNEFYPKHLPLSMPNIPDKAKADPKMTNGVNASWNLDIERFFISTAATYLANTITFTPNDILLDPDLADASPYGDALDADLWTNVNAGVTIFSSVMAEGGILFKNDLNSSNSSNLGEYRLALTGRHNGIRKRFFLDWNLAEHFLGSDAVAARSSWSGLSTELGTKLIYKIKPFFLIRGTADIELSGNMLKLHYEAGVRKQWKKGSTMDFFYSGTNGVLFPRQITAIQSKLCLFPHFGIAPDVRIIFGKVGLESKPRYYRSDYAMELFFPIFERYEIFSEYLYRHYKDHLLFSSYNSVSFGLRKW